MNVIVAEHMRKLSHFRNILSDYFNIVEIFEWKV